MYWTIKHYHKKEYCLVSGASNAKEAYQLAKGCGELTDEYAAYSFVCTFRRPVRPIKCKVEFLEENYAV